MKNVRLNFNLWLDPILIFILLNNYWEFDIILSFGQSSSKPWCIMQGMIIIYALDIQEMTVSLINVTDLFQLLQ